MDPEIIAAAISAAVKFYGGTRYRLEEFSFRRASRDT
jgi:hypothetical protein